MHVQIRLCVICIFFVPSSISMVTNNTDLIHVILLSFPDTEIESIKAFVYVQVALLLHQNLRSFHICILQYFNIHHHHPSFT